MEGGKKGGGRKGWVRGGKKERGMGGWRKGKCQPSKEHYLSCPPPPL